MTASDVLTLAADDPTALAVLRLAEADAQEQWLMVELRRQIHLRRLGVLVNVDRPLSCARYIQLRADVEGWLQVRAGLRDDLTGREADGEVLGSLWWLLSGEPYCRGCFDGADTVVDMHPVGGCTVLRVAS